jgi:hypothetical protein
MENNNCLAKILNVINILQNNAEKIECQDNSCTKPFLGPNTNILCFNTRPITLYRCDNSLVTLNYTNANNEELTTTIFRIENVNNDSIGVLLLEQTTDEEGNITYLNTNTYATINLKCICAIRCLNDVIVDNV